MNAAREAAAWRARATYWRRRYIDQVRISDRAVEREFYETYWVVMGLVLISGCVGAGLYWWLVN